MLYTRHGQTAALQRIAEDPVSTFEFEFEFRRNYVGKTPKIDISCVTLEKTQPNFLCPQHNFLLKFGHPCNILCDAVEALV